MPTHDELVSCVADLARRVGHRKSIEKYRAQEEDFRSGRRTELRPTINDSPLEAVAFLEELRRAVEDAQCGLISQMGSTAAGGPTLTELGAALNVTKQSGRKRAAVAARWSEEYELPTSEYGIEDLARSYPPAGQRGDDDHASAGPAIHWPVDDSPHPDVFGHSVQTQEDIARKAMAMGIGISVNR